MLNISVFRINIKDLIFYDVHLFYFIIYCMAYITMLYRGGKSIIYYIYALITPKPPLPQMRHILSVGGTNVHN